MVTADRTQPYRNNCIISDPAGKVLNFWPWVSFYSAATLNLDIGSRREVKVVLMILLWSQLWKFIIDGWAAEFKDDLFWTMELLNWTSTTVRISQFSPLFPVFLRIQKECSRSQRIATKTFSCTLSEVANPQGKCKMNFIGSLTRLKRPENRSYYRGH